MITKPYPAWIDSVPYTPGFSQPDFQMFDGTGDPHPHLAHFLVRCRPVAQNGALRALRTIIGGPASLKSRSRLGKQGSRSSGSSSATHKERRVGVPEQLKTKPRDNEPVTEFIARWRAPTFACPQKLTQQELLKMCMNKHDLSSILLPQTFQGFDDLCTKAHDVEAHLSKQRRPTN